MELLSQLINMLIDQKVNKSGQSLVELLIALAITAIVLPALLTGLLASRDGRAQQTQRVEAITKLKQLQDAVRSIRNQGWTNLPANGTYHPTLSGTNWTLTNGSDTVNGFTRQVLVEDVNRDPATGAIVSSGGTRDPSSKKVTITISWSSPLSTSISSTLYLTRYMDNLVYSQSTAAQFTTNTHNQTQSTNTSGGEVTLGNNTKAKWCSPEFSASTIDLPDGPPVSVDATASASITSPNDVFVATGPYATSSAKMAYINVTANTDPPISSLRGIFTLDAAQYSAPQYIPSSIGIDNSFITNDIKYYKSAANKVYALIATNLPDKEVIAIQVSDGSNDSFQDPTNKIYKYWTFFNTRMYQGNTTSTPNQDYSPYGYGGVSLAVLNNKGYLASGGYLYVFDLANIDTKTTSSGLDMVGCRIEMDGYDCNPTTSRITKYGAGNTGANFQSESAGQTGCMDGGAVAKYGVSDIYPVKVGTNTYVYAAVGAGANPELNIINVSSVPTNSSSPRINNSSCGRISGGNSGWKRVGSYDFNSRSGTQESANSVFATADGSRAYISSNGGVDGNNDGQPDSYQLYIINTSNKSAPSFLSGSPSTGPSSGYYSGNSTNIQMFPRRSLTVLNGQRAVVVGQDGFPADATNPQEYQVLNIDNEATPNYCGGLDFPSGFNDLTYVVEADHDTFVYMIANTMVKQLKIIQGGPDGTYVGEGDMTSAYLDTQFSSAFNRYSVNFTSPTNTTLSLQFAVANAINGSCANATYDFIGPDGTASTYYTNTTGGIKMGDYGNYTNPGRCFKYKTFMTTTDYNTTPVLQDITVNYSP